MTRPGIYLFRILLFLGAVVGVGVLLGQGLIEAFSHSPFLNGLILGVTLLGILFIVRQVILLEPEKRWFLRLRHESQDRLIFPESVAKLPPPRLLGPLARMLGERRGRLSLSATSMRTLLDGIQNRIDESHDLARYLVGLLVFLGLLGTFWGLSQTVGAVGETISAMGGNAGDPAAMFEQLKAGLETPLTGMGTAFSSSLFGLAGSLILGFLELQSHQAHGRFQQDLEEWLSGVTKFSIAPGSGGGEEGSVPAYIQALLEQTAESLDNLQRTIARGEDDRTSSSRSLGALTERLGHLTNQLQNQQSVLVTLAETQVQLRLVIQQLSEQQGQGFDEASQHNLRNATLYLERLASDVESGKTQIAQELRSEIRLLTRTLAGLTGEKN